jgi:hypothetical protein
LGEGYRMWLRGKEKGRRVGEFRREDRLKAER